VKVGAYIVSGILTVIPLWITWLVVNFVFRQLLFLGRPIVSSIRQYTGYYMPPIAEQINWTAVDDVLAVLPTLTGFYLLGWAVSRVIGRRLLSMFEAILNRIPIVPKIYGGVKQLISALEKKPDGTNRVVLIDFPSPEMKSVGLVTRVMTDQDTHRKLAIVYVPTTPNPTSGYLEVVPLERVVPTDWTLDEAMNFVISAGAVAPDRIRYSNLGGQQDGTNATAETVPSAPSGYPADV
jgi:uncharacterized membrane protein